MTLPDPWALARQVLDPDSRRLAAREQLRADLEEMHAELSGCDRHRPADPPTLRVAAEQLASRGMTACDIASALRLSEAAVRQMLAWEAA